MNKYTNDIIMAHHTTELCPKHKGPLGRCTFIWKPIFKQLAERRPKVISRLKDPPKLDRLKTFLALLNGYEKIMFPSQIGGPDKYSFYGP